jgi:glutaredoxin
MPYLMALFFLALAANAWAERVYQWTDAAGNTHFGDVAPGDRPAKSLDIRLPPVDPNQKTGKKTVVLYGTEWCGTCAKARRYFKERGIAYRDLDIEKSPTARDEFKRLGGKSVPIILIGEKRLNGFSAAGFKRLYD